MSCKGATDTLTGIHLLLGVGSLVVMGAGVFSGGTASVGWHVTQGLAGLFMNNAATGAGYIANNPYDDEINNYLDMCNNIEDDNKQTKQLSKWTYDLKMGLIEVNKVQGELDDAADSYRKKVAILQSKQTAMRWKLLQNAAMNVLLLLLAFMYILNKKKRK